jgi:hypothetical protein
MMIALQRTRPLLAALGLLSASVGIANAQSAGGRITDPATIKAPGIIESSDMPHIVVRQQLPIPAVVGCQAWQDIKHKIDIHFDNMRGNARLVVNAWFEDTVVTDGLKDWEGLSVDDRKVLISRMLQVATVALGRKVQLHHGSIEDDPKIAGVQYTGTPFINLKLVGRDVFESMKTLLHEIGHNHQDGLTAAVRQHRRTLSHGVETAVKTSKALAPYLNDSDAWKGLSNTQRIDAMKAATTEVNAKYPSVYYGSNVPMFLPSDANRVHTSIFDATLELYEWHTEGVMKKMYPVEETFRARNAFSGGLTAVDKDGRQFRWNYSPVEISANVMMNAGAPLITAKLAESRRDNPVDIFFKTIYKDKAWLVYITHGTALHPNQSREGLDHLRDAISEVFGLRVNTDDVKTLDDVGFLQVYNRVQEQFRQRAVGEALGKWQQTPKTGDTMHDWRQMLKASPHLSGTIKQDPRNGQVVPYQTTLKALPKTLLTPAAAEVLEQITVQGQRPTAATIASLAKTRLGITVAKGSSDATTVIYAVATKLTESLHTKYAEKLKTASDKYQRAITIAKPDNWKHLSDTAKLDAIKQMSVQIQKAYSNDFPKGYVAIAPSKEGLEYIDFSGLKGMLVKQYAIASISKTNPDAAKLNGDYFSSLKDLPYQLSGAVYQLIGAVRDADDIAKVITPPPQIRHSIVNKCVAPVEYVVTRL